MTAALARRGGALALAALLGVASLLLGAGVASAQTRQLECVVLQPGQSLGAPVTLQQGERVQLVLVLPLLGNRVDVGPVQTAQPGLTKLTADAVTSVISGVCQVAVQVQAAVAPVVPPSALPTVPAPVVPPPTQPQPGLNLPLPGVDVGVQPPGAVVPPGATPPGTTPPGATPPGSAPPGTTPDAPGGTPSTEPGFRFDPGALPAYDFSRTPFGVSSRFGAMAAPAFRFGRQLPGYAPQFGVLDDETDEVARAGDARAMPIVGAGGVALPVLLAVLMLSAVAGALVRTWVLRRAA